MIIFSRFPEFAAEIVLPSTASLQPAVSHSTEVFSQNAHKSSVYSQSAHQSSDSVVSSWTQFHPSGPHSDIISGYSGNSCGSVKQPQQQLELSQRFLGPAISRMSRIIEESVRQDSLNTTEGRAAGSSVMCHVVLQENITNFQVFT
jgi:hypothetical protein